MAFQVWGTLMLLQEESPKVGASAPVTSILMNFQPAASGLVDGSPERKTSTRLDVGGVQLTSTMQVPWMLASYPAPPLELLAPPEEPLEELPLYESGPAST
jgi:hypothetical protein